LSSWHAISELRHNLFSPQRLPTAIPCRLVRRFFVNLTTPLRVLGHRLSSLTRHGRLFYLAAQSLAAFIGGLADRSCQRIGSTRIERARGCVFC
jgi:hypothetical protein